MSDPDPTFTDYFGSGFESYKNTHFTVFLKRRDISFCGMEVYSDFKLFRVIFIFFVLFSIVHFVEKL